MRTESAGESDRTHRAFGSIQDLTGWILVAAAAFHGACAFTPASFLLPIYLFALVRLAQAPTWRKAFYSGLIVGLLIALGRLGFFWRIFSGGAIGLWIVFAFWIGLFVALARLSLLRFGNRFGWLFIPVIWAGLEYFRSELYYLRFAWLSPGYGVCGSPLQGLLKLTGTYGLGFLLTGVACASARAWAGSKVRSGFILAAGAAALCLLGLAGPGNRSPVSSYIRIAGVQMEFPSESEIINRLNDLIHRYPNTDLVVLSEYTLADQVPGRLEDWCRKHHRYLVIGGKDPATNGNFYNTAFVVAPTGLIDFRQVKAVPIQFFKDGLPAPEQKLWNSPWGRIGLCICYDLSYRRVVDRLVKQGAEALIVPTMDVVDWGENQHQLHARVAPVRASEYGIPIFRLASSGISQYVDAQGKVQASAPCPGDGAVLLGSLEMRGPGHLPADHWLAPAAALVTAALVLLWMVYRGGDGSSPHQSSDIASNHGHRPGVAHTFQSVYPEGSRCWPQTFLSALRDREMNPNGLNTRNAGWKACGTADKNVRATVAPAAFSTSA